ncbi:hypothetical protein GCM10009775_05800 [Microbacterium aoyamense]|uniref:Uncharacterized protein n=1 Tax=Microbacterium aoyamense TaxID=344166 RepID=A0ABP5AKK4_9MICO|nr:hypothetical protein [Microbacterium aoyamense]
MSTTIEAPADPEPDAAPARSKSAKRVWITLIVVIVGALVIGGLVLFSWMIDETHFDRPSAEFDALEEQVAALPHVEAVEKERWVEAPGFWTPTSWMAVTVDAAGLPALLELACANEYADPVTWSFLVVTPATAQVSLHSTEFPARATGCPDFGFDALSVVDAADRLAPGIPIQPSIWFEGTFALVALEDYAVSGYAHLLPLVEHSDAWLAAAGLDAQDSVEINSMNLGMLIEPGESAAYLALLRELADEHAVTSFWADGAGTPTDGVEKVQIVAPDREHAAIEDLIRSSGLHITEMPVRFIEQ